VTTQAPPAWRAETVRGPGRWPVRVDVAGIDRVTDGSAPGILLVPASMHERDAFGVQLVRLLTGLGATVAATDIRGRGDSREPTAFASLPPGQLLAVRGDVAAALDLLAAQPTVDPARLVVFAEQDTADSAAFTAAVDRRVSALVLISARLGSDTLAAIAARRLAVCGLVGKEDAVGMLSVTAAYRASAAGPSRLRVVAGLGPGTTMFAAWQYLHPDRPTLEEWLAAWCTATIAPSENRRR
jgi:dienelactone hydrolase